MIKEAIKQQKELILDEVKRSDLGKQLASFQRELLLRNQSLVILVDGFESSGKSSVIKDLIRELDPRYFEVKTFEDPSDEEHQYPFLRRFMSKFPKLGHITVFDRSFYYTVLSNYKIEDEELQLKIDDIRFIEDLLLNDNTILIKYFLVQSEKKMEKRVKELKADPFRHFFIDKEDEHQLKNYDKYLKHFNKVLEMSNTDKAPWHIVYTDNISEASRYVLMATNNFVKVNFQTEFKEPQLNLVHNNFKPLSGLDLSKTLSEKEYDEEIDKLQEEASDLLYTLYQEKKSGVIVFEGTDASGKGGAIKRLTRLFDPRIYHVSTTAAPTKEEITHNYLWRFYRELPPKGHLTIFDRSWYGRVMVERIEGFTPLYRTQQAYEEINEFEYSLITDDMFVLKFLIVIDKDTQYNRFMDRKNNPDKDYKLTDEDWRNREKFDDYVDAMNEMVNRTSTSYAPWFLIAGTDKKSARIEVLKIFNSHVKEFLKKK